MVSSLNACAKDMAPVSFSPNPSDGFNRLAANCGRLRYGGKGVFAIPQYGMANTPMHRLDESEQAKLLALGLQLRGGRLHEP